MHTNPQRTKNIGNYNEIAEAQVIGCVLLDPDSLPLAREIIKPSDFYNIANQEIFSAMCEIEDSGKLIDIATLYTKLSANPQFNEQGGMNYLIECGNNMPSSAFITTYANLVRSDSLRRKIKQFSEKISVASANPTDDVDTIIAQLGDELLNIASATTVTPWKDFRTSLQTAYNELFNTEEGEKVSSGFVDLDSKLTGLKPGALTIVAARPAMGKTAFGLNVLSHVAFNLKMPVAFFSLEMTTTELINRLLSSLATINGNAIRQKKMTDEEWNRLLEVAEKYNDANIFIDETPGIDIAVLRERAKRLHRLYGIKLLIVDYLQLMHADNKRVLNREQEVATISRGLKGIAKELQIPVVALAQLNRALDARADKHPILSDLRESGSIEQDSDNILFIHREDYYRQEDQRDNTAEIIIAKQRSGPTGVVKLHWAGEYTRFSNLEFNQ